MNKHRKGNQTQLKAIKALESCGWLVAKVERTGRFEKFKDLFSASNNGYGFDLMAIKPDRTRLVQVKTNKWPPKEPYEAFAKNFPQFEVVVMNWIDKKKRFEEREYSREEQYYVDLGGHRYIWSVPRPKALFKLGDLK